MRAKSTSHHPRPIMLAIFCALFAAGLLGSAGDGGCGPKPADQLCTETGGTWGPGANWPTPCGADPLEVTGPAAKEGESVCACPSNKPNWTDGVGCRKCESPREICGRTGGTWGPGTNWPTKCGDDPLDTKGPAVAAGQKVCSCPADRPNWTDGEGCKYCKTTREVCTGTGGTWGPGANWPAKCGDDPLDTKGPAAAPGQKVCSCPAAKPNWTDGEGCKYCKTTREVCTGTGGTWGPGANWPPACGDDPLDGPGPAAQAGEKVCSCPAAKPNWTDGTGCRACKSDHQTCTESGGTWGSATYWPTPCGDDPVLAVGPRATGTRGVCLCPVNKPNWSDSTGCLSCAITAGRCSGYSNDCYHFDGYETTCWEQKGCYWDSTYDECKGSSSFCSSFYDEWSCAAQRGCDWNPVSSNANPRGTCSGYSDDCYHFDSNYDLCWMQSGCYFDLEDNECKGSSKLCSSIYNQVACATQRGCTWRQLL